MIMMLGKMLLVVNLNLQLRLALATNSLCFLSATKTLTNYQIKLKIILRRSQAPYEEASQGNLVSVFSFSLLLFCFLCLSDIEILEV